MQIYSGGPLEVPETTLPRTLFANVSKTPDATAVQYRPAKGQPYVSLSWRQTGEAIREVANGLLAFGVQKGDRVAILADTAWQWTMADYGILSAGGVTVTVYPTLTADQIAYLVKDSGSKAIFVDSAVQYAKLEKVAGDLGGISRIVTFEGVASKNGLAKITMSLDDLRAQGRAYALSNPKVLDERLASVKGDDLATIVYTSGTTGTPKGAMLTHKNFISAYLGAHNLLKAPSGAHSLAFLPLAHCYGRLLVLWVLDKAGIVAYSNPASLGDDLRTIQPQLICSVPRLYERMYDQIQMAMAKESERTQKIFAKAAATAREMGQARSNGGSPGIGLRVKHAVFDRLVYSKLRAKLGMTNMQLCFTGSAAIRPDLLYFFQGIGVPIVEGYGLTETSAPSNVNTREKFKPGSVGPPFPGMEMTLADDGEVLMRGPNVFQGYYNLPKETDESFTVIDGKRWFKTGDIGKFDEDGYLAIVDRKKELEVLDTGKKIAPVSVEEKLKLSPFVGEAMLIGTGRKYAGALVQPNYDRLVGWAKQNGISFDEKQVVIKPDPTGQPMTYSVGNDLLGDPKVLQLYGDEIKKTNEKCADYEQVRVWRLIPNAISIERDELTMTLKKKRRIIAKNYNNLIDEMFRSKG